MKRMLLVLSLLSTFSACAASPTGSAPAIDVDAGVDEKGFCSWVAGLYVKCRKSESYGACNAASMRFCCGGNSPEPGCVLYRSDVRSN